MSKPLILLVEDDADMLELTQTLLESDGFIVMTASHGRRALDLLGALETTPPNVIVTDLMMPVMDGLDFIREYRKSRAPLAPIIATSAMPGYLDEALRLGAACVVGKPFDSATLIGAVRRALTAPAQAEHWPAITVEDERRRLDTVVRLMLDKPALEIGLSEFVDHIAKFFDVPICLVTSILAEDQYWSAACGLPSKLAADRRDRREDSFCTHAVAARSALVVQDASTNPFFRENIWVREHSLRFYAGVPLVHHTGDAVGTLCIIDYRPRLFTRHDLALLTVLARRILGDLEWRERATNPEAPVTRYLCYVDRELGILGRDGFVDLLTIEALRAIESEGKLTALGVRVPHEHLRECANQLNAAFTKGWVGRLDEDVLGIATSEPEDEAVSKVKSILRGRGIVAARSVKAHPTMIFEVLKEIDVALESPDPFN